MSWFVFFLFPLTWLCVALWASSSTSSSEPPEGFPIQELKQLYSTCSTNGQFNGVCLVAQGEKVIYRQAFGHRTLDPTALDDQTAFEIASVTKPITATAILLLVKEGKLKLSQDVSEFFKEWPYAGITIQHLLTHTSGLPDYTLLFASDWETNRVASNADLIQRLIQRKPPVYFPAGAGWSYSNTGFAVLASLIERISGQTYAQFLRDRIFRPLAMKRSGVSPHQETNMAQGYLLTKQGYQRWWLNHHLDGIVGDGGVYSTADDLHRFVQALFAEKLLGSLTETMLTPIRTRDGGYHYHGVGSGLGWNLKFEGEDPTPVQVFHTGNYGGFRAVVWHDLRKQWTLILLDNLCHNLDEIWSATEAILAGKPWILPKKSIQDAMLLAMQKGGLTSALQTYQKIKSEQPEAYNLGERELNTLGYILLNDHATAEAIEVFKLNTQENPRSLNAFDSLAEAYVKKGDLAEAIRCYEETVKLNPQYQPGIEAIASLKKRLDQQKN